MKNITLEEARELYKQGSMAKKNSIKKLYRRRNI